MLKIDSRGQLYLQTIFDVGIAHRVVREFYPSSPLVGNVPNRHDGRRLQLLELVDTAMGDRPIQYAFYPEEKDVIIDAFRQKAAQPDPERKDWDVAQSQYLLENVERPVPIPEQRQPLTLRALGSLVFSH